MSEQVQKIAVAALHGFKDHPFQVKDDESFQELCDSIQKYGVLSPLLARPTNDGYEIVSGHRRKAAALSLGMDRLPGTRAGYDRRRGCDSDGGQQYPERKSAAQRKGVCV